jgi:hypothetical protein
MTRKYTWLKDLSSMHYGRELSHICGYTRELDVTFYGKKILHLCGYWKIILFIWSWATPILVDYETSCVGKTIFLSFRAYKEYPNQRSYTSCALIWKQGGPGLWIGNKYGMSINVIWTNWKETWILDIHIARKYTWLKDLSSMYYGRELSCFCGYTQELDLMERKYCISMGTGKWFYFYDCRWLQF